MSVCSAKALEVDQSLTARLIIEHIHSSTRGQSRDND